MALVTMDFESGGGAVIEPYEVNFACDMCNYVSGYDYHTYIEYDVTNYSKVTVNHKMTDAWFDSCKARFIVDGVGTDFTSTTSGVISEIDVSNATRFGIRAWMSGNGRRTLSGTIKFE